MLKSEYKTMEELVIDNLNLLNDYKITPQTQPQTQTPRTQTINQNTLDSCCEAIKNNKCLRNPEDFIPKLPQSKNNIECILEKIKDKNPNNEKINELINLIKVYIIKNEPSERMNLEMQTGSSSSSDDDLKSNINLKEVIL